MSVCYRSKGAASHVRSANPFTQLSDGGCTCRHRYTPFPPLPFPALQQTSLEHPPRVASRFAQVASWTFAYPIDENLHTHTRTHTRAHTCEWVHVSALIAGIWKFRHLFDQLLPFSYRERDEKGTKESCPTISYATHIAIANGIAIQQKSCWQIKTANVIRKLSPPTSPFSLFLSLCFYISVYKCIPASCTCGTL